MEHLPFPILLNCSFRILVSICLNDSSCSTHLHTVHHRPFFSSTLPSKWTNLTIQLSEKMVSTSRACCLTSSISSIEAASPSSGNRSYQLTSVRSPKIYANPTPLSMLPLSSHSCSLIATLNALDTVSMSSVTGRSTSSISEGLE